jgi:hypothetical protein
LIATSHPRKASLGPRHPYNESGGWKVPVNETPDGLLKVG